MVVVRVVVVANVLDVPALAAAETVAVGATVAATSAGTAVATVAADFVWLGSDEQAASKPLIRINPNQQLRKFTVFLLLPICLRAG